MFFTKPKVRLTRIQEARLEYITKQTGIHPNTILEDMVDKGISEWLAKLQPKRPPKCPSGPPPIPEPPPTKFIRDHGGINITIPEPPKGPGPRIIKENF